MRYKLYLYGEGQPVIEASYDFMNQFKMNPPEVIGNHDLNKQLNDGKVPLEYTLRLSDIKTLAQDNLSGFFLIIFSPILYKSCCLILTLYPHSVSFKQAKILFFNAFKFS